MKEKSLKALLHQYKEGSISEEEMLFSLQSQGFTDLGFAKIDLDRERRGGFPEVVYCEGKTTEQAVEIIRVLWERSEGNVLATRCSAEIAAAVKAEIPQAEYHELAKVLSIYKKEKEGERKICITEEKKGLL